MKYRPQRNIARKSIWSFLAATLIALSSNSTVVSKPNIETFSYSVSASKHNQLTLVLFFDGNTDQQWVHATSNLKSHFNLIYIDVNHAESNSLPFSKTHDGKDAATLRYSNSPNAAKHLQQISEEYDLSESCFSLPDNSNDLFELTILFHQTMDTLKQPQSTIDS